MGFIKSLRRLSRQASTRQNICSTGTIHMWAVVTITKLMRQDMQAETLEALVDAGGAGESAVQLEVRTLDAGSAETTSQSIEPRQSRGSWSAFAAFASLMSALCPLLLLCYNFSAPSSNCAAHTDCKAGEVCVWGGSSFLGWVCRDCDNVARVEATWSEAHCAFRLKDRGIKPWDEADHTKIDILHEEDKELKFCFMKWQCDKTDAKHLKCDHFFLNKAGFSLVSAQGVVLMGLSFVAAMALAVDMDETMVEELFLNHEFVMSTDTLNSEIFAAHVVRLTLRIRRLVLPGVVSTATVYVLVTNPLTSQGIILNMLALQFFVEIDDMLALFVLPAAALEDMQQRAARASEEWQDHNSEQFGLRTTGAWIKVRLSAFACAVFVVFVVQYLDVLAALLNDQTCDGIKRTLVKLAAVPALLNSMIEMVHELFDAVVTNSRVGSAEVITLNRLPCRTAFREFFLDLLSVLIYAVVGCRVAGLLALTLGASVLFLCVLIAYVALWCPSQSLSQLHPVKHNFENLPCNTIGRDMHSSEDLTIAGERQNVGDVDNAMSNMERYRGEQLREVALRTDCAGVRNLFRSLSVEHDARSRDMASEIPGQIITDHAISLERRKSL